MAVVIKKQGKLEKAYELGRASAMEYEMLAEGKIIRTAAADAVLVFYKIERNSQTGEIRDVDFNFVARAEFDATYHYVG